MPWLWQAGLLVAILLTMFSMMLWLGPRFDSEWSAARSGATVAPLSP